MAVLLGAWASALIAAGWKLQAGSPSKNWRKIICDSTGQYYYAITSSASDYVYSSNDWGITWTQQTGIGPSTWSDIVCDSTGQYVVATPVASGTPTRSTNYGVTWNPLSALTPAVRLYVACSSDGTKIFFVRINGVVDKSTNSGTSFTAITLGSNPGGTMNPVGMACDSTGQYVFVGVFDNAVSGATYYSTNTGTSFTRSTNLIHSTNNDNWAASNASGSLQFFAMSGSGIDQSTNHGSTWSLIAGSPNPGNPGTRSFGIDSTGTILIVAPNGTGFLQVSTNTGSSWTAQAGAGSRVWNCATSNAAGNRFAACVRGGQIWTYA